MAKLHTMPVVKQINSEFPLGSRDYVPLYQHVDDMTNLFTANNAANLTETVVIYANRMSQLLTQRGLTVSDKTTLVPMNKVTEAISKGLKSQGVPVSVEQSNLDLGVQMSADP